jgi:ubiquinone/menaquinone biosynthesis C-methylase UbiE
MAEIFDDWAQKYDSWFETPLGKIVKEYESGVLFEMAQPTNGEHFLDVGCGTGIFTEGLLAAGAHVTGLELSFPMLRLAGKKASNYSFHMVQGNMLRLPFADNCFDKTVSVTAIEFIEDGQRAVGELFRVTRPGGLVVVASLNSLSPWATRRMQAAKEGHAIFSHARFRSPSEMADLARFPAVVKTAVHFQKHHDPGLARQIEEDCVAQGLDTGAFLIVSWRKPVKSEA